MPLMNANTKETMQSLNSSKAKEKSEERAVETEAGKHDVVDAISELGAAVEPEPAFNGDPNTETDFWNIPNQECIENVDENVDDDEETIALLQELPHETRQLLKTAACLGSLDTTLLQASTKHGNGNLSHHLSNAVHHGVIVSSRDDPPNDSIYVSDDTLDSIYRQIPHDEQGRQHVAIGRNLVENLSQQDVEFNYFIVLRQFKLGVDSITHQNERNAIANLCLAAGEHAVSKGDFISACHYLDFGIHLLNESNCWKDEYDLTLALYNDAAEVEYSKSNFVRVDKLVATVLENARNFRDSLRARASRIYSLSTRYKMTEAVDESLQVLHHLGETFPSEPTRFHIGRELSRVWRLLKNKTNEMILRMPLMTDPDKLATVQILNLLFPGAYRTRPKLWGLIVLRLVRLTLLYGLSPVSAVGFAFYAAISSMISRDIDGSSRYGELALSLLQKFHAREWVPRVYLGIYGHTSSYKYFLRDVYPKFDEAHQVGLETGDIEFSCLAASIRCIYHVFSGDSLMVLEKESRVYSETFKGHNQETAMRMMSPLRQFVENLLGKNDDPRILVGGVIKDEAAISELLSKAEECHDEISIAFINYFLLLLAYIFNDFEAAEEEAKRIQRITRPPYLHPSMSSPYTFYALAFLAVYDNRRGRARQRIVSIAKRCIKKLKHYSLYTPENCLGKAFLIQAELAAVTGKKQEAKCHYESAISVSTRYGDFMMHAVACERAGRFSNSCGDESAATRYFHEAHSVYKEWGATAKTLQMKKELPEIFQL